MRNSSQPDAVSRLQIKVFPGAGVPGDPDCLARCGHALEQLDLQPQAEEVLKAVLERAEHLEEQASGMTVLTSDGCLVGTSSHDV